MMIKSGGLASADLEEIPPFDWLMPLAPWEDPEVLRRTIRSLVQQTLQARALVVSVDGQITPQLEQVLSTSGLPVELHQAELWQGTGLVLARGLLACRSDIVLRVDADDVSVSDRSRWQVELMMADPQLAVLGGQLEEVGDFDEDSISQKLRSVPLSTKAIKSLACWRNPMNHPTVALRRSVVISVGNYRSCPYFEDWDLWLRMLQKGCILCNDHRVFVRAGVGPDHLSRRHGWKYLKAELSFFLGAMQFSLIPVFVVFLQCLARPPLRLIPKPWLSWLMSLLMRRHG
jgi:glycosyltransferase involved in cell wall biosynthesis